MPLPDVLYLQHMLDALRRLEQYVRGTTCEAFRNDPLVQDAVIRQLTVLGEAAGKLSPGFTRVHGEIPWPDITGIRHKLVHDYFVVDVDVVWVTATNDAPALRALLEALLDDVEGSPAETE
jgi:uncharacterized protein with HEPN domain